MMRPVILAMTGAEAMTLRAQVDVQIDRETEILEKGQPDQEAQRMLNDRISMLRALRDKLDAALTVREAVIKVPF